MRKLDNIHIGDTVRIFTYAGTVLGGHAKIPNLVQEDRFGDHINEPLNPNEDGLRFVGVYIGTKNMRAAMNVDVLKQEEEPYAQLQVLCQNTAENPFLYGRPDSNNPDLIIPERLIRRYQILEPAYSSQVLPLEEIAETESLKTA